MDIKLKSLSKEAIPAALDKARQYRLLNESVEAESICLDVLEVEPDNQQALIIMLLAVTDQFVLELNPAFGNAQELLNRLCDGYCRSYYSGIILERRAKVHLSRGGLGSGALAYDWFRQAMEAYEAAIKIRPSGNDEALLRWNTCARILMKHPELKPDIEDREEQMLE
jgi:tetratricopeptide (TPR) repeat protein